MKKILLLLLGFNLFAADFNAQNIIFSEDFDGISGPTAGGAGTYNFPSGWFLRNVDNQTPNASVSYVNEAWVRREDFSFNVTDSAAFSTSYYSPGGLSDDYMWTPLIGPLTANCQLSWNAVTYDGSYPDGYEVRVMTGASGPPTGGTGVLGNQISSSTQVFSIGAENTSWTNRTVSLAAYAGQSVYIGFHNRSNDKFMLSIDDIVVEQILYRDAKLVSIDTAFEYTQIPVKQAKASSWGGKIYNNGINSLSNVHLKVDIYDAAQQHINTYSSSMLASLASGATGTFTINNVEISDTVGNYTLVFSPMMDESDQDSSNDSILKTILYTDSTYARDNGIVTGQLGIGAGNGGYLGQEYMIHDTAQLTSISMYITRGYTNKKMAAVVYSTLANGTPDALIAATDTLLYPDDSARWYHLPIQTTLNPGKYVIAAVEFDSTLQMGQTSQIFTNGKVWVNWPTSPFGNWANVEAFGGGFAKSCAIRPNFGLTAPSSTNFTVSDSIICAGDSITFSAPSLVGVTYNWTFPGGNPASSNDQNPTVTYASATNTTASLFVSNINGQSGAVTKNIDVFASPNVTASASDSTICAGDSIFVKGHGAVSYVWTASVTDSVYFKPSGTNTYTVTGTDGNNCSSTNYITINVNTLPTVTANASTTTVCPGDTVILSGSGAVSFVWTGGIMDSVKFVPVGTNTYTVTGTDANNCSNTNDITVTVTAAADLTTNVSGNVIAANQAGGTYQWIDCDNGNDTIVGATAQSYTVTASGNYAVIVTLNGCSDTSTCVNVTYTGINENITLNKVNVYPNPSNGEFFIEAKTATTISVMNSLGQIVYEANLNASNSFKVQTDKLTQGVYFVKSQDQIIKVIVQ